MSFTDDPIKDFERYDADQEGTLESLPRCCECCNPIQQEYAVYINDEWICDECLEGYRKAVEAYG